MAGRPTDDELRAMLRTLPRPEPPSGFAAGVMARVRAEERRRRFRPWLLAAAAATLVASGLLVRSVWEGSGTDGGAPRVVATPETVDPERREFEAILEEYRLLAEEIDAIQRLSGDSPHGPLIRVGGNEDLDLFVDLESFLDRPARPPGASLVVPASDRRPRY